jgi:hypothetical protein
MKIVFGKICFIGALCTWASFFGLYFVDLPIARWLHELGLDRRTADLVSNLNLLTLMLLASWLVWVKYLKHLDESPVVDSRSVNMGILILAISLVSFPGTLIGPLLYTEITGDNSFAGLAYMSLMGMPIFGLLSLIGLCLLIKK